MNEKYKTIAVFPNTFKKLVEVKDRVLRDSNLSSLDQFFNLIMPELVRLAVKDKWDIIKAILEARFNIEVVEIDVPPYITYKKLGE